MNELKQTVAMLFSRKGKPSMTETNFILMASMGFRWFPPKDAQKLLDIAIETNLVTRKDGEIVPNFDLKSVEIPLDFSPGAEILRTRSKEMDLFSQVLERIQSESQTDEKGLISRLNSIQSDMDITIEVAALIVGRELGVDLSSFYETVRKGL
ncbi:MAG: DUF2240 family protein [Thermoplasmata archaeon]